MNRKRQMQPDTAQPNDDPDPDPEAKTPRLDSDGFNAKHHSVRMRYDDYTVVWISALPFEVTAAQAMLDRQHEPLPPVKGDSNSYLLGNISGHNIVIAFLPKGLYGTHSALEVLSNTRRSFPAIQCGLMVGICGGASSQLHDIRLGDVIVGTLVTPYGPGKVTNKGTRRTGPSFIPNESLLKVVMRLEAQREKNIEKVSERMREILTARRPKMLNFKHPGILDYFFRPAYAHSDDATADCQVCCDLTQVVQRDRRPTTDPKIHAGVIASGDHLIKESCYRDELAAELDALCFEMESAGLMRVLPCLPIRGVANYADSHKNDDWQLYAAANAAAYARELLETLPSPSPPQGSMKSGVEAIHAQLRRRSGLISGSD